MAFTELFTGLQQGVFDGQENPISMIVTNRLYEVQPYITLTGHVYSANPFIVKKNVLGFEISSPCP
ncbi:hypothetical protein [Halalkalibacter alkalisediminis]|uniref:Uncharacterized protein n=1 Tax=Halalkalibacter alkalisediminis TaxID=935616 RepID=A0ABV6NBS6_9BACI|nr:hypothetical protein [Halalkalibacter alkalisediminis]